MRLVRRVAAASGKGDKGVLDFTVPEALLLIDRVAVRLRADIRDKVPFSDRISVGTLLWLWERRDVAWKEVKEANPGITEAAMFGTLDNPIANSVANQARSVLQANPNINVVFAPYDEFAKGVKIAVDEAGLNQDIAIYSADVSTADISAMREPDSAWAATVATNPAVVGEVSVRTLALMLAGEDPGKQVVVPPTLITQDFLNEQDVKNMEELGQKMPQFQHADVSVAEWIPLPAR